MDDSGLLNFPEFVKVLNDVSPPKNHHNRSHSQHQEQQKIKENTTCETTKARTATPLRAVTRCFVVSQVVCAYASFEDEDVLKFGFDLFDEDGSGAIDEYEMARMVYWGLGVDVF